MTPLKRLPFHDASQIAGVGHKDRMMTAAFFVLLAHGVLILGVTFSSGQASSANGPTFAVTLVQRHAAKAPKQARLIAQANQRGHGNTKKHVRPAAPVSTEDKTRHAGALGARAHASQRAPAPPSAADNVVTTTGEARHKQASSRLARRPDRSARRLIARLSTPSRAAVDPTAKQATKPEAHDDNPRERTISVDTKKSRFARYLDKWRKHVTRIGNLNYPAAIRRQHLSGQLTLEVALNADGTLRKLTLVKPSKQPALNAAALTIVRSGAPYAPFPESIKKDTDVLKFVFVWQFSNGRLNGG
jgi:protein TonB